LLLENAASFVRSGRTVAVRGDPTQNLDALSEPVLVVRGGAIQVGG
jgi:hypothetical protein